jgi:hypothetical protein
VYGEHCSLVSAEVAAPIEMKSFFFSCATFAIARLVPELVPPTSMSTPCVSNHSRAFAGSDVGLVLVVGDDAPRPSCRRPIRPCRRSPSGSPSAPAGPSMSA